MDKTGKENLCPQGTHFLVVGVKGAARNKHITRHQVLINAERKIKQGKGMMGRRVYFRQWSGKLSLRVLFEQIPEAIWESLRG